jgi:predicted nucleic acid-binding protein
VTVPVVVDCSALAEVVLRSERAAAVEALFEGESLVAPDLIARRCSR